MSQSAKKSLCRTEVNLDENRSFYRSFDLYMLESQKIHCKVRTVNLNPLPWRVSKNNLITFTWLVHFPFSYLSWVLFENIYRHLSHGRLPFTDNNMREKKNENLWIHFHEWWYQFTFLKSYFGPKIQKEVKQSSKKIFPETTRALI